MTASVEGVSQTGFPFFSSSGVTGEPHADIMVKVGGGAGASAYRDGVLKTSNSWNPTVPAVTQSVLGGFIGNTAGVTASDYIGKIGEHIILGEAANGSIVSTLSANQLAYFGI